MYLQLGTWRLELLTALANQKLPDTNDEKLFEISTAIHGNLQTLDRCVLYLFGLSSGA